MIRLKFLAAILLTAASIGAPAVEAQNKPIIGIGEFNARRGLSADPIALQAMIETALAKTQKFDLIERSRLGDLVGEQALSSTEYINDATAQGNISGVDYLLYGSITEATLEEKSIIIGRNCQITVGVDARIVDVATGAIRMTDRVVISERSSILDNPQAPCRGQTFDEINRKIADSLAEKISIALFPVKVINVSNGQVYLNYSSPSLNKGDYLKLVSVGESFVDPDTGEVLGSEEEVIGLVRVNSTRAKFSIADILSADIDPEVGMVAVAMDEKEGKTLAKSLKKRR